MNQPETQAKSKEYSAVKTRIFVIDFVLTIVLLFVFQLFLSRPVSLAALNIHSNFYIACFAFTCVFLFFMYVAGFPLHFIGSFVVERRFGLSRQTFKTWLVDEGKSLVLSFLLSIISILVFYLVLRNFSSIWWAVLAIVWVLFSIVLTRLMPVLLIPIFYKYFPIKDQALKESIMMLAEKAKIKLMNVCQIDFSKKTAKANAALVGLGKTRKVILADTLMENFTFGEIEGVVAHEFGHFKYRHIWQLLTFSGILTISGFFILSLIAEKVVVASGASSLSDFYLFPSLVLLMVAFGIIILPAQNFFSRRLERGADRFALDLTGDSETFASVMKKLAAMNLSDMTPSVFKKIFLYNHPPVSERIRMAQAWGKSD